jgi:hypothetical protein
VKVDNSYSTSDALRRYGKAATGVPFPQGEDAPEGAPRKPAPTGAPMDRVTLSREARGLLAAGALPGDAPPEPAGPELTYAAPIAPVAAA